MKDACINACRLLIADTYAMTEKNFKYLFRAIL